MIQELAYQDLELSQNYKSGYTADIYESPSDTTVVVKNVRALFDRGNRITNYDRAMFMHEVGGDLSVLRSPKYSLTEFIPKTQLAWGKENPLLQQESGFIVMEKVEGQRIQDVWELDSNLAKQLDLLLSRSLILGLHNLNVQKGVRRIPDIINALGFINIIVGATPGDPEIRPYLIDTYPASVGIDSNYGVWKEALEWLRTQSNGYEYASTQEQMRIFFKSPQLRRRE